VRSAARVVDINDAGMRIEYVGGAYRGESLELSAPGRQDTIACSLASAVHAENPVRGCSGVPSSHRTLAVVVQPGGDGDSGEPSSPRPGWPEPDPVHSTLLNPPLWPTCIAWSEAGA